MQLKTKSGPASCRSLVGHENEYKIIIMAAEEKHSSWLLCGQRGIGKASTAYMAIKRIFGADKSVQQQKIIEEQIASNNFLDLVVVNEDSISVNDVRRINGFLHTTPAFSKWRIVLIDSVDCMSHSAMNAMLKILEEPPDHSLFFLISHRPGSLPATIRSRCFKVNFGVLSDSEMTRVLSSCIGVNDVAKVVPMAGGSPGAALSLLNFNAADLYCDFLSMISARRIDYEKIENFGLNLELWSTAFLVAQFLLSRIIKVSAWAKVSGEIMCGEFAILEDISKRYTAQSFIEKWAELGQNLHFVNDLNLGSNQVLVAFFHSLF
jgi:DNA polymerase-3 subunit delta'